MSNENKKYRYEKPSKNQYPEDWKALDMGWDVWKRPMLFSEIKAIMDKKPIKRLHHSGVNPFV